MGVTGMAVVHAQTNPAPSPTAESGLTTPAVPVTNPATPAAANGPLTLGAAIAIALQRQPSIAQAAATKEVAAQQLRQRQSQYYPTVTPEYSYTSNYSFAPVTEVVPTGTTLDAATSTKAAQPSITRQATTTVVTTTTKQGRVFETKNGDVGLSYRLLDNGTRNLSTQQARQNLRASTFGELDTRRQIIANVATAYFAVLRNNALVQVDQAQVQRAQNTLDVTQAQVEAGTVARKDVLQARADLLNAQVALLQARNNARLSQTQLRSTLGTIEAGGPVSGELLLADVPAPTDQAPATAQLPANAVTSVDEDAIRAYTQVALKQRPDLLQTIENVDAGRTGVRLQQANAGLNVTADVGAGFQYVPYTGSDRKINVAATYPLFDGGLTRAQVRAAQAGVRADQAALASLQQQIAVDVEQAYRNLAQAKATLPSAKAALDAAQVNYDAAIEARREGAGSLVDVITAQTSLVQAQQNYVQDVYDYYSADAALASAVGQADRIGTAMPAATVPSAP